MKPATKANFYRRDKSAKTWSSPCKACKKALRDSHREEIRAWKDSHREEIRAQSKTYRRTEKGRRAARSSKAKYRRLHPDRIRARNAVYQALAAGRLVLGKCERCGRPPAIVNGSQWIESHHYNGYSREHQLDVQWLCREGCHPAADVADRE